MAGVLGTLKAAAAVACAAGVPKTVLQGISATNHRAKCLSWGVAFDGVSGVATPVLVELVRQSDGGTATGVTGVKINLSDDETLSTTGGSNCSAEPTPVSVIGGVDVHPQGGFQETFPFGQELPFSGTANRLGIRVTAPANVNCVPFIRFEE